MTEKGLVGRIRRTLLFRKANRQLVLVIDGFANVRSLCFPKIGKQSHDDDENEFDDPEIGSHRTNSTMMRIAAAKAKHTIALLRRERRKNSLTNLRRISICLYLFV